MGYKELHRKILKAQLLADKISYFTSEIVERVDLADLEECEEARAKDELFIDAENGVFKKLNKANKSIDRLTEDLNKSYYLNNRLEERIIGLEKRIEELNLIIYTLSGEPK